VTAGIAATFGAAGPWAAFLGLALLVVWLVFTGRLVPRRVHEQAITAERQRGDDFRDAHRAVLARCEVQDRQLDEILTFVRQAPREAA